MSHTPRYLDGLRQEQTTHVLLTSVLEATVPFRILELRERGGPTQTDWDEATAYGDRLAHEGDALLYRGKKGQTQSMCTGLIRALAVAAFVPGGVTFAGVHFDANT